MRCRSGWLLNLSLVGVGSLLLHGHPSAAFLNTFQKSSNRAAFQCSSSSSSRLMRRTRSRHVMGLSPSQDGDVILPLSSSSSSAARSQLPLSSALMPISKQQQQQQQQQHDIVIVGGGLAGLSAALYVTQMDPTRRVTIVDREAIGGKTIIGSMAAAGMLAPQSERLPPGPLLDICLASRRMFAEYCQFVERLAQSAATEEHLDFWSHLDAHVPLHEQQTRQQLHPWSVGYVASGGFLAPAFAGDSVATWAPPPEAAANAVWLDAIQIREMEPHLHPQVIGGWWFPEDASVDARRLTCSLRAACHVAGVELCQGPAYEVTSLDLVDGSCRGIWLKNGQYLRPNKVLVANGSWMRQLLPVPIEPHKGQSLSLRMPSDRPPILRRVLFAQDSYLVPKADGRIIVGATVEAGSFDPNVTPAGLMHIMSYALQLVPGLADLPVEETWVGLRPTTPDKGPILGKTPWDNLYLAAGYWRNGVLLAPKTGQLVASILLDQPLSPEDQTLVDAFGWDRFTTARGGAKLAAEARLAAAMHPIHSRVTGAGVAASVGTELGSYSMARSASSERQQDRAALFGTGADNSDDALERAAALGKQDAAAYSNFGRPDGSEVVNTSFDAPRADVEESQPLETTTRFEGTPDAFTVGSSSINNSGPEEEATATSSPSSTHNLNDLYEKIKKNKPARNVVMHDPVEEERPDPGFRIYQANAVTGELQEVPPYTSLASLGQQQQQPQRTAASGSETTRQTPSSPELEDAGDSIFDGYQAIQDAAAAAPSEEDASVAMRRARLENRFGALETIEPDLDTSTLASQSHHQAPNGVHKNDYQETKDPLLVPDDDSDGGDYDEKTLDGYQTIHDAYSNNNAEEEQAEREALREIRRRNRLGQSEIDMKKVGAQRTPGL